MTDATKPKRTRNVAQAPKDEVPPAGKTTDATPETGKSAQAPQPETAKPESKAARVLALLQRSEGATLDEMVAATGWLPHTTRASLTGLKKKGHVITSTKTDGVRRYQAAMQ